MARPFDSRRGSSGSEIVNGVAPWVSPKRVPTGTPKAAESASSEATDGWRSEDSRRDKWDIEYSRELGSPFESHSLVLASGSQGIADGRHRRGFSCHTCTLRPSCLRGNSICGKLILRK